MNPVRNYLSEYQTLLNHLPERMIHRVIDVLHEGRIRQRQVFIMGNGGSASTASHFACDLGKNTRKTGWPNYRVIGLTDNMALFSAYANDEGYENVFVQQLASFVMPGDIVIGISTSGNSSNVVKAIELARLVGALTIGFTGFDGGQLGNLVDIHVHVPSDCIEQVEDAHLMLEHLISKTLRERIGQTNEADMIRPALQVPELVGKTAASNGQGLHQGQPSIELPYGVQDYPVTSPRARASLDLLYSLDREVLSVGAERELLGRILKLSLEAVAAASGSIVLFDEIGTIRETAVAYQGHIKESASPQLVQTVYHGLTGWVLENRQAALVDNTRHDPRWLCTDWEAHIPGSRSAISVPLVHDERVIGVLTVTHTGEGRFTEEDLVLLAAVAVCISSVHSQALVRTDHA